MKTKHVLTSVVLLTLTSLASAGIEVEITDHPVEVWLYSPVFVTAKVTNVGENLEIVPCGAERTFIETGRVGEALLNRQRERVLAATRGCPLASEESFLFQLEATPWVMEEGTFRVRVGIHGLGSCRLRFPVDDTAEIASLEIAEGTGVYQCWEGRAVSEETRIEVFKPPNVGADARALEFLTSPEFPVPLPIGATEMRLYHGARHFQERFPASHYTYAAILRSEYDLGWLLEHQPNHPLTPYTRMKAALQRVELAAKRGEQSDLVVADLEIPQALRDFVAQQKQIMEDQRAKGSKQDE